MFPFPLSSQGRHIQYQENFEGKTPWVGIHTQFPEQHSFERVPSPVSEGNFSGKFELRFGDKKITSTGIRSEVLIFPTGNNEKWYYFDVYFPSAGWIADKDEELITQWRTEGNPEISLRIKHDELILRIGHNKGIPTNLWHHYKLGKLKKDKWLKFRFHIVHSNRDDGVVELLEDDELLVQHFGPNTLSHNQELPHWKLGLYKWTWEKRRTLVHKRVIYFDNIKIEGE